GGGREGLLADGGLLRRDRRDAIRRVARLRHGLGVGLGRVHQSLFLRWARRAMVVSSRTPTTSVSAEAHARATMSSFGACTSLKIWIGSEFIWLPSANDVPSSEKDVNSSGAVSPAARATASSDPVTRPGRAVGRTMRKMTFHRGAPSASADSRSE